MAYQTDAELELEVKDWRPTDSQKERIAFVFSEYQDMMNKRQQRYPQFNDRTLLEFIDDNEKRMNAYVLDKASQGKEEWQANFATRIYANKSKALLAAVARDIPDIQFKATNKDNDYNFFASDVMDNLTRYSYQRENPQVDLFFLGWSLVCRGTVFSYEGFSQHVFNKKKIKSYDILTGDVEFEEVEQKSTIDPVSFEVPLENILIKNFYVYDIQDQPAIIWWTYYADRERFEYDWGQHPNVKFVKDSKDIIPDENSTYFHDVWKEEVKDGKGYLVLRYMNRYKDKYCVVANGVELYNGPMLWESSVNRGQKVYPLAKEIFEPFASGRFFFYGNSQPNSAMGEGDVLNTLFNTAVDKQYRSMVPPLLIGMVNKDMLDLEDEVVAGDTKIYVDDINQVKQMDIRGLTDSDVSMIRLISGNINMTTLDPTQEGTAEKYVTARAALTADERARQLKGVFFMFLESLWLQKIRLRAFNILVSYMKPQIIEEGDEAREKFRTFNIEGAELSDKTTGTLSISVAADRDMLQKMRPDIERDEDMMQANGKAFEKIGIVYDFLERFTYDVQIVPSTLWKSSQSLAMAMALEKATTFAKLFPRLFMVNEDIFAKDIMKQYDESPEKYTFPPPQPPQQPGAEGEEEQPTAGAGGLLSDITGAGSNNSLARLTGVAPE